MRGSGATLVELRLRGEDEPVIAALRDVGLASEGRLLDIGGAAGRIAAGIVARFPGWSGEVLEPSAEAISAGRRAFPLLVFRHGQISEPPSTDRFDLVVLSFVLHWVEHEELAQAIASTDRVLRDGGLLVIADFAPESPRANPYAHAPGLFTWKHDYEACFLALCTYHEMLRVQYFSGSACDPSDPYDRRCAVTVLRKDLGVGHASA